MAMTRFEKLFVNRERKGIRNFERLRERLAELDVSAIQEALEVGCGIGTTTARLADAYPIKVWGVDFDPEQIELAKSRYVEEERLCYRVEDAGNLSFADASFDLVISYNVFHHLPDWRAAVGEVSRVLRPSGHLMWLDLVFPALVRHLRASFRGASLYTLAEIEEAFARAGLTAIFHERVTPLPIPHHHFVWRKTSETPTDPNWNGSPAVPEKVG